MSRLPFEGRIFWKVLPTVYVLSVVAWVLIVRFSDYEMTPADYGGTFISVTIFAYLIHLWMLPGDHLEEEEYEHDPEEAAEVDPTEPSLATPEEPGAAEEPPPGEGD